ncbi:MAG: hypothetical protein QNJ06_07560 [Kiloniellales bacterium]|nr:hypothetical protein [Kiloniellales bacterium]MDJ0981872.1 hypothetical protein [Kiloniellales bacterium]
MTAIGAWDRRIADVEQRRHGNLARSQALLQSGSDQSGGILGGLDEGRVTGRHGEDLSGLTGAGLLDRGADLADAPPTACAGGRDALLDGRSERRRRLQPAESG